MKLREYIVNIAYYIMLPSIHILASCNNSVSVTESKRGSLTQQNIDNQLESTTEESNDAQTENLVYQQQQAAEDLFSNTGPGSSLPEPPLENEHTPVNRSHNHKEAAGSDEPEVASVPVNVAGAFLAGYAGRTPQGDIIVGVNPYCKIPNFPAFICRLDSEFLGAFNKSEIDTALSFNKYKTDNIERTIQYLSSDDKNRSGLWHFEYKILDSKTLKDDLNPLLLSTVPGYESLKITNPATIVPDIHEIAISERAELWFRYFDFSEADNRDIYKRGTFVHFLINKTFLTSDFTIGFADFDSSYETVYLVPGIETPDTVRPGQNGLYNYIELENRNDPTKNPNNPAGDLLIKVIKQNQVTVNPDNTSKSSYTVSKAEINEIFSNSIYITVITRTDDDNGITIESLPNLTPKTGRSELYGGDDSTNNRGAFNISCDSNKDGDIINLHICQTSDNSNQPQVFVDGIQKSGPNKFRETFSVKLHLDLWDLGDMDGFCSRKIEVFWPKTGDRITIPNTIGNHWIGPASLFSDFNEDYAVNNIYRLNNHISGWRKKDLAGIYKVPDVNCDYFNN